ncbi:MAG: hypothetical protein LBR53_07340 [Deltaproteobacteria bacterium]|jgi:hypothetical protein|nr:hypothetical protein [Deltaproteobacteria bacterium]
MARDLTIGKEAAKKAEPACRAAEHCCWYETSRETARECSHRNELVCQLRREEVFGESKLAQDAFSEEAPSGRLGTNLGF